VAAAYYHRDAWISIPASHVFQLSRTCGLS